MFSKLSNPQKNCIANEGIFMPMWLSLPDTEVFEINTIVDAHRVLKKGGATLFQGLPIICSMV
jgi:hypothetical protein